MYGALIESSVFDYFSNAVQKDVGTHPECKTNKNGERQLVFIVRYRFHIEPENIRDGKKKNIYRNFIRGRKNNNRINKSKSRNNTKLRIYSYSFVLYTLTDKNRGKKIFSAQHKVH